MSLETYIHASPIDRIDLQSVQIIHSLNHQIQRSAADFAATAEHPLL